MTITSTDYDETLKAMRQALSSVVPDGELQIKAELVCEINKLKREQSVVILGHNYMEPALFHTVPDLVGDSLGLSQAAADTEAETIVFCGVEFMAETAKILSPQKKVLLPAKEAGCSLASSITAQDVRDLKALFPGVPVVTYVNTYADVKAEVDVCCTSSNAFDVVHSLQSDRIIFLPDEYLSRNVAQDANLPITVSFRNEKGEIELDDEFNKGILAWRGRCEVHEQFSVSDIENARKQFPDIEVVSHPECSPDVVSQSDFSGSTTKLVEYVQQSKAPRFLILTECSMGDNIIAQNPEKEIVRLCSIRCPHMNQITLEDTLHALQFGEKEIFVPEEIRVKALSSVERMLSIV
ncbi:MAG: quinolinate synthase NadA [Bdellovibrionales bacterium]|nr:quinolinate synthase NadA [Bdellovibrionales bacterium]